MLTHAFIAPIQTHFRPATCAEVECDEYVKGFMLIADERTDLGIAQVAYVRTDRDRSPSSIERREDGLTYVTYPPGTRPFAGPRHDHVVPLEREPVFYSHGGDFRAETTQRRVFDRPDQWVDDFATHLDDINSTRERG